jgi:predicted nucleotidyltransferase component of viral defense system
MSVMRGAERSSSQEPTPGGLDERERRAVQAQFGVADEQVRRDHAISHALAAIASTGTDDVVFFGGTALSRTLLPSLRLSEDIDLIARGDRAVIGDRLETAISRRLRGVLGAVTFTPRFRDTARAAPSVMLAGDVSIQIQLVSSDGYPDWPTEIVEIEQRYSDASPARLRVLTPAAFVASKLASWVDREAPRDLYDLWALALAGRIDAEACRLYARFGQFTSVASVSFLRSPTEHDWNAALSHQCVPQVTPSEAAQVVRRALDEISH